MILCLHCKIDINSGEQHSIGCPNRPTTQYGGLACPNCLEPYTLPGEHTCKPSYVELKAQLTEYQNQIMFVIAQMCINCDDVEECEYPCAGLMMVAKAIPDMKDLIIESCTLPPASKLPML